jgi:glucuronosyltransferase
VLADLTEVLLSAKELKEFLDGAAMGAILFSLGTNVRSETMSSEKKQVFLSAFAELPQRVLWKWEANHTSDLPDNVKLAKWLPQQDVLGESHDWFHLSNGSVSIAGLGT